MDFKLLGAVLASCAAIVSSASAQALYSPPEGDFSVAFDGAPSVQAQPAKKSRDVGFRRYVDQSGARALVVAIDQYPQGGLPQLVDAGVYDHLLRDHAESSGAQLVFTKPARLAGKPCLEGAFKDSNDEVELVRVLIIGDRIWRLTYAYPAAVDQAGAPNAFFSSFKINTGAEH
jgi:hypothetical protein